MWDKVIEIAASNGLWALMFCALLIFELKDSRAREAKYQGTIAKLSQDLGYMYSMDKSIEKIHRHMRDCLERNSFSAVGEEA